MTQQKEEPEFLLLHDMTVYRIGIAIKDVKRLRKWTIASRYKKCKKAYIKLLFDNNLDGALYEAAVEWGYTNDDFVKKTSRYYIFAIPIIKSKVDAISKYFNQSK